MVIISSNYEIMENPLFTNLKIETNEPLIQIREVSKIYPTVNGGFSALKKVSFDFFTGEFVGIVGKSGAGKTTLVNLMSGIDHLSGGKISIGGVSISDLPESHASVWRGRNLGIIYQSFRLMPTLSLLDNILFPIDLCGEYQRKSSRERAMELLRSVELLDHAHKLPSAISGGQQQRVAIARALANDPPIIIADEPTGRLDSATSDIVYAIFSQLAQQGKLVIMVTHDTSVFKKLDRHIELVDGEVKFDSRISEGRL